MKTSINIDVGGTFTDCFIVRDGTFYMVKTPTTTYDLSVGFMRAIREGAALIGISVEELLQETEIVRYSTTVAMNSLIQRKGSLLALITTAGFEDVIHMGKGAQWADGLTPREMRNLGRMEKPEPLIRRDMVVGVKERVDSFGNVLMALDEEDFREKLDFLVNKGARGFVVSLLWAHVNPVHERRIKEIIKEEYPEIYLGNMPVVLSHEVLPKAREYPRTMAAVLNAYLHQSMAEELNNMADELRAMQFRKPMMLIHNNGGMAEVYRTTAIQTYNGGPVAGLIGSAYVARLHGYNNVVVSDMGGTSFDLGLIIEGSARFYAFQPVIDRWMVDITMLETVSIGAGGGSIAWINEVAGKKLEVGPMSAGSMPGPVCYDQGGIEPTVTDADVVLGYINPEYYHGGRMRLNRDRAAQAIREKIARPLGLEVEEAALLIKKIIDNRAADAIFKETVLRGHDPEDFILFAFGGAGPTHCCGYAFRAGVPKIMIFPYSPVFCAFGSTTMDTIHVTEQSRRVPLLLPGGKEYMSDYAAFNRVVRELQERALKEIRLEGLPTEEVMFALELDMKFGGQIHSLRISSPCISVNGEDDLRAIYEEFAREYARVYSPFSLYPEGGVDIENFCLKATISQPKPELPVFEVKGTVPPREALKGRRPAYWEEYGGFHQTPVYDQRLLECGNIIEGPAIIEGEDTTTVLPPGTRMRVNRYLNCEIEKL